MNSIYEVRILIVDDNKDLLHLLCEQLSGAGYRHIQTAANCAAAKKLFAAEIPELMILDINLPDGDGFSLFRALHAKADVPALFLSARDADADRLFGLGLGADDYLTKPFSVDELLARLRVIQRRLMKSENISVTEFVNGRLRIDYVSGCVHLDDEEIHLTPIEYKLLCLLAKNVGKVLTHKYIIQSVWGTPADNSEASLRVFMATLRKKLSDSSQALIQTHIGIGYRMMKL